MLLLYKTLEHAHSSGHWSTLRVPPECDHAFFARIQQHLWESASPQTVHVVLSHTLWLAQKLFVLRSMPAPPSLLAEQLDRAIALVKSERQPRHSPHSNTAAQLHWRLYHAANLAWHTVHGLLPRPLPRPAPPRTGSTAPRIAPNRVFTEDEVRPSGSLSASTRQVATRVPDPFVTRPRESPRGMRCCLSCCSPPACASAPSADYAGTTCATR